MMPRITLAHVKPEAIAERFWSKVGMKGPDVCWMWTAAYTNARYGQFTLDTRTSIPAHRVAYYLATGRDPGRKVVCHTCDTPGCVNPNHLWLGTHADNMRDMATKGRGGYWNLKVTEALITEVSAVYNACTGGRLPNGTQLELARKYGVSKSTIARIGAGKTWGKPPILDYCVQEEDTLP